MYTVTVVVVVNRWRYEVGRAEGEEVERKHEPEGLLRVRTSTCFGVDLTVFMLANFCHPSKINLCVSPMHISEHDVGVTR